MDVLSGMVTKKGRFGTDPYIISATTGCRERRLPWMLFRAWLQKRVGLEPTPTIFSQPRDVEDAVPYTG